MTQRDSIDFGTANVGTLFRKQLLPTVLGMVFSALFIITDGIFVGRGIGSDALAAVNIAAPMFLLSTGIGLMFGMGGAVVASINLARGKERIANINATQATVVSAALMAVISIAVIAFPWAFARALGAPQQIIGMATEYLLVYAMVAIVHTMLSMLTFFVRVDGPKVAMWCMTIAAVINIVLDYLFIFIFKWGLSGAAAATGIGEAVGVVMMIIYLQYYSPRIRLGRLKLSSKSMTLTMRNTWYIVKLGFSAFLSEIAIAIMILTGNYMFVRLIGTAGVAAFSIVCYFFPIIFMVFNAVIQSAQPIISFNYGCGQDQRANKVSSLALWTTISLGAVFTLAFILLREQVVSLFITDTANAAWEIATTGIPLFAAGYIFFGINIITAGYYISTENTVSATVVTLLRGIILPVVCFFTLPLYLGVDGIWLAVPVAEALTALGIGIALTIQNLKRSGTVYTINT